MVLEAEKRKGGFSLKGAEGILGLKFVNLGALGGGGALALVQRNYIFYFGCLGAGYIFYRIEYPLWMKVMGTMNHFSNSRIQILNPVSEWKCPSLSVFFSFFSSKRVE